MAKVFVDRQFVLLIRIPRPDRCAVGVGHIADRIDRLGKLLDIEVVRVR